MNSFFLLLSSIRSVMSVVKDYATTKWIPETKKVAQNQGTKWRSYGDVEVVKHA